LNRANLKQNIGNTTIEVSNSRSIRVHEAVGFKIIYEFDDRFGNCWSYFGIGIKEADGMFKRN